MQISAAYNPSNVTAKRDRKHIHKSFVYNREGLTSFVRRTYPHFYVLTLLLPSISFHDINIIPTKWQVCGMLRRASYCNLNSAYYLAIAF